MVKVMYNEQLVYKVVIGVFFGILSTPNRIPTRGQ